MPLTVQVDGKYVNGSSTPNNQIRAKWFNDYHDLLTGAMTDQVVTLKTDVIVQAIGGVPGAPTLALAAGTTLGIGNYQYGVTFVDNNGGETTAGAGASITTTSGSQAVNVSAIPTGPVGTAKRHLWRTLVGGSAWYLLATLNDNTTTTYADTTADASLGAQYAISHPSFGGTLIIKDSSGATRAQVFSDGAVSFDTGKITSDGSGNITAASYAGTSTVAKLGLNLYSGTTTNGDIQNWTNGHDATYWVTLGIGDPTGGFGAGLYAYDQKNQGAIFQNGTKNGIVFNGSVTANGTSRFQATASAYDLITLVSKDTTWSTNMGVGDGVGFKPAGWYAWDSKNGGFIFSGATNTSITFGGNGVFNGGLTLSGGGTALSVLNGAIQTLAIQVAGGGWSNDIQLDTTNHIVNYWTPSNNATPWGQNIFGWDGTNQRAAISIQPNGVAYIGTNRNGAAATVPIFTGTNTPVNPPTGSIWIKA